MAQVYTYLVILAGISVLLGFAGIQTGANVLLSTTGLVDNAQNFEGTDFFASIRAILLTVGITTIVVGLFFRQSSESFLLGGFSATLLSFGADYIALIQYMEGLDGGGWGTKLLTLILIPLIVGYGLSILAWWRGTD